MVEIETNIYKYVATTAYGQMIFPTAIVGSLRREGYETVRRNGEEVRAYEGDGGVRVAVKANGELTVRGDLYGRRLAVLRLELLTKINFREIKVA